MIDTVKIYTEINKSLHDIIQSQSIVKSSINNNTKEVLYQITNDSLERKLR